MRAGRADTKTDLAYGFIKQRILRGDFSPGNRLILDRIAREADVSQVPVREALRRLEAEGYVVYEHNSGARVAELDAAAYEDTQQAIAVLEGAATAAAAPFVTTTMIEKAADLNEEMKRCRAAFDPEGFIRLNGEFHDLLCEPCPNTYLADLLARARARMALIRRPTLGIIMRLSHIFLDDHAALLRLIQEDPHAAVLQTFAQAHKMRMLQPVLAEVAQAEHHTLS